MNSLEVLPAYFIIFYIALFGLCIGSFLNVVIIRGLTGEGIVFERSKCPKCKTQLKWYMNIPLLSYIFLKGKCGFCKSKISPQYPIIEALSAFFFLIIYFVFGLTLKTLFLWIIISLFITMSATDFKETVIIDTHAYILLGIGLLYSWLNLGDINIIQGIIGSVFGFLIFELLAKFGQLLTGCRMFGEGDSLIALGLGAMFGWKSLLIIIALSILLQAVGTFPILIHKTLKENKAKLSISYITVGISIIYLFLANTFSLSDNTTIYFSIVFLITICLIWALKNLLVEINNKKNITTIQEEEKFCLLPFGPALLISATVCIFYLSEIKSYILDYIY